MHRPSTALLLPAVVVLGLVASTVPAQAVPAGPGTGTVQGVVTRSDTTTPLAGTTVAAETGQGVVLATTTTAADGTYTLTGVPAGDRLICADGSALSTPDAGAGWLPDCHVDQIVHVTRGAATVGVDRSEYPAAALQGQVTEPGGLPLAGVVVSSGAPGYPEVAPVRTGADGRYRFVVDPRYVPYLAPCFDGATATGTRSTVGYLRTCATYPAGTYSFPVVAGQTTVADQQLRPASALSGKVVDPAGGGVGGIRVIASSRPGQGPDVDGRTTTAADGTWSLTGLAAGASVYLGFAPDLTSTAARPSPTGYLPTCWRSQLSHDGSFCAYEQGATAVTTPSGTTKTGLHLVLPRAGGITGRLTDSLGRAVPGALVGTFGVQATTDADGVYRITGLPTAGYYTVCTHFGWQPYGAAFPDPQGYDDACWTAPGSDDDPADGTPVPVTAGQLVTGKDIVVQGRGALATRVVGPDGTGLATIAVHVAGPGTPSDYYTDSDGTLELGRLTAGTYTLCFSTSPQVQPTAAAPFGYGRRCVQTTVTDSQTTTVPDVALPVAGRITGTVTDVYGFPLGGVTVTVADARSGDPVAQASVDGYGSGAWGIAGLAPGRYTVCFSAPYGYRPSDNTRPPQGYAPQCWRSRTGDQPPVVVTVTAAGDLTGISARLRAA